MDDSEDREAILARRAMLIAGALAGLTLGGCDREGAQIVDQGVEGADAGALDTGDAGDASDAGNDAAAEGDGGPADAAAGGADDAGARADGGDGGVDALLDGGPRDAGSDAAARDAAPRKAGGGGIVRKKRPKDWPEVGPLACLFLRRPLDE